MKGGAMPILRIVKRGLSPDLYDATAAELDLDTQHPPGLILHGATEVKGAMHIAQIWESREHARRFDEEVLVPALEAVGAPLDAEIATFELHHLVTS
jgi:hypothetical protein